MLQRLEEAGSWIAYLKGFAIFIPCLWPSDDRKAMTCLALRGLNIFQGRVFGLLVPRQIGVITDKLMEGLGVMPWKDIGLWTLYRWIDSHAGFELIDSYASLVVSNYSSKRIYDLAFNHVMGLEMDFHTGKDSGEVLRSVEQAHSLESLIETVFFRFSWTSSSPCFLYIWIRVSSTRWTQPFRRVSNEKNHSQNRILYESVSNWQTVSYFNRRSFERDRFSTSMQESIDAVYSYMFRSWAGYAFQEMILKPCRATLRQMTKSEDVTIELLAAPNPRPVTLDTPRLWAPAALTSPTDDDTLDCVDGHLAERNHGPCRQCTDERSGALGAIGLVYCLVLSTFQANDPFIYGAHFKGRPIYKHIKCGSREAAAAEAFYATGVDGWNVVFCCVMREGETFWERSGPVERVEDLWNLTEDASDDDVVRIYY